MFTRNVGQPLLASEIGDRYFERIVRYGEIYMRDYSLVATIRALLHSRMPADDTLVIRYRDTSLDAGACRHSDFKTVIDSMFIRGDKSNLFCLTNLSGNQQEGEKVLEALDSLFVEGMDGYHELTDVKAFVSVNMDARFYINSETKTTLVVVNRLTMSKYHFLQALISRFIPWYFADKPLTEQDRALVKSCSVRQSSDYERIIAEYADQIDLRKVQIQMIIGDFEKNARKEQIKNADRELSRVNDSIRENLEQFTRLCDKRDRAMVQLEGLKSLQGKVDQNSELIEFFERNKNLNPLSAEGNAFRFIVRGYLDTFDPDNYACYARNWESCYYTGYSVERDELRSPEDRKLILDAIFSEDPKLRIRTCGYYQLYMNGDAHSSRGFSYPAEYNDCMPNPHLHFHDCLGNQLRFIKEAILNGDMVQAVAQCLSSVSSVNTGESATMRPFVRDLFNGHTKCIESPDGKMMDAVEALAWLKAQAAA